MLSKKYPSIEELKTLFRYDPDSGEIFWIVSGKGKIKKKAAGTLENTGYYGIMIEGRRLRSHRIAWALYYGQWPKDQIDHINGIITDNRITNLRAATNLQNGKNFKKKSNNTSGHTGVSFRGKRWRVQIKVNYKLIYLGTYKTLDEAIKVRTEAEIKYFGEWRRGNEDSNFCNKS